jgi:hypothetical protein
MIASVWDFAIKIVIAGLKRAFCNVDDSPLVENIYAEAMPNFNILTLDNFKGSDDN